MTLHLSVYVAVARRTEADPRQVDAFVSSVNNHL